MATYLLTWNPDIANFPEMETTWSTGRRKTVQRNSDFFFLQQGDHGRGIIGRGKITSKVTERPHWDTERAAKGDRANYVDVEFTKLIDPFENPEQRLDVRALKAANLRRGIWEPQASGSEVFDKEATQIEALWQRQGNGTADPPPPDSPTLPWVRDEVILVLDLYFRVNRKRLSEEDEGVIELSDLLNVLPLHPHNYSQGPFRSPGDVVTKLGQFRSLDPRHKGERSVPVAAVDEEVWEEFADDPQRLRTLAEAIQNNADFVPAPATEEDGIAEDEEFIEGRILTRLHTIRERDREAVRQKKDQAMQRYGTLRCEVCDFDASKVYGNAGLGQAECHHRRPLSELNGKRATRLSDLAIVCANCHRMLHAFKPAKTVEGLRVVVESCRREGQRIRP